VSLWSAGGDYRDKSAHSYIVALRDRSRDTDRCEGLAVEALQSCFEFLVAGQERIEPIATAYEVKSDRRAGRAGDHPPGPELEECRLSDEPAFCVRYELSDDCSRRDLASDADRGAAVGFSQPDGRRTTAGTNSNVPRTIGHYPDGLALRRPSNEVLSHIERRRYA
jgi:hypothetical protein